MTEDTVAVNLWDSFSKPDKVYNRRVLVLVKVVDLVESRYGPNQELIWADSMRVLDWNDRTDFDIIEFYESVIDSVKEPA